MFEKLGTFPAFKCYEILERYDRKKYYDLPLRGMFPHPEMFRSVFSWIWAEFRDSLDECLYPLQTQENADKKTLNMETFYAVCIVQMKLLK